MHWENYWRTYLAQSSILGGQPAITYNDKFVRKWRGSPTSERQALFFATTTIASTNPKVVTEADHIANS